MTQSTDITLIIVSYNTRTLLCQCLSSVLAAQQDLTMQIIVVDNASLDGSANQVEQSFPQVELIRSTQNLGFAAANNLAFQQATGRFIVLLNPDAQLQSNTLKQAVSLMYNHPQVGLAGARLIGRNGNDEPSARLFPSLLNEFLVLSGLAAHFPHSKLCGRFDRTWAKATEPAPVDWVPGAFAIIRAEVLQQIGYFDERFFLYYEEVDLCRRIKQHGWAIYYWPQLVVQHLGGESAKTITNQLFNRAGSQLTLWQLRSMLLYFRKHHAYLIARLVWQLHYIWQSLRRLRKQQQGHVQQSEQLQQQLDLLQQAWQDTQGGLYSPPRPW